MASARSSSSLVTNSECFTLSDSTQCSTEVNEMYIPPATSEIVIAVQKMVDDDNQTELVIGKDHFIPVNFSNSELVRDMITTTACMLYSCTDVHIVAYYY